MESHGVQTGPSCFAVRRFASNPIIRPDMNASIGDNINGPSLIRVPDWVEKPLGRYYLYFAHHKGTRIRLAYADRLEGPWKVYAPGVLRLEDSLFEHHVASPDVHIDPERRQIRMYCHGPTPDGQKTRVALSNDGLHFTIRPEILGDSYFRAFRWNGWWYAMAMPGVFYRSRDGLTGFQRGPTPFAGIVRPPRMMRHAALLLEANTLRVFYTCIGDCPERILMSEIALTPDWADWMASPAVEVLRPQTQYEGADLPLDASRSGPATQPVRQLRDPAIYREGGAVYLLYSVAGEQGIAIAELILPRQRPGQASGRVG
ncbi:MAG: hypothetical protein ACPMAQ_08465 [Phycisphaerae bacterium]